MGGIVEIVKFVDTLSAPDEACDTPRAGWRLPSVAVVA
jgi:hypothetical protein